MVSKKNKNRLDLAFSIFQLAILLGVVACFAYGFFWVFQNKQIVIDFVDNGVSRVITWVGF
jgi:uncharacterized protein (UPF0333 family)